jgi:hypothetical protein
MAEEKNASNSAVFESVKCESSYSTGCVINALGGEFDYKGDFRLSE